MLRGTLRKGAFGQHCAFKGQLRQWRMLAIYRSVSPSLTSRPVVAFRPVDYRDVRRNLLVVDEPVEVCSRAVGRIGCEPFGLDVEAPLGALDHRLRRPDLSLADGT